MVPGPPTMAVPPDALVILIGAAGSGKTTFARRNFRSTEVVSSDACRALVADDPTNVSATRAAFAVLHFIAAKRLAAGRLTVVDATNVLPRARRPLVGLATRYGRPTVGIVFHMPLDTCLAQNRRRHRRVPVGVVRRHVAQLEESIPELRHEGFGVLFYLASPDEARGARVVRGPGGTTAAR